MDTLVPVLATIGVVVVLGVIIFGAGLIGWLLHRHQAQPPVQFAFLNGGGPWAPGQQGYGAPYQGQPWPASPQAPPGGHGSGPRVMYLEGHGPPQGTGPGWSRAPLSRPPEASQDRQRETAPTRPFRDGSSVDSDTTPTFEGAAPRHLPGEAIIPMPDDSGEY